MICMKCGAENAEKATSCGQCGADLRRQAGEKLTARSFDQSFAPNAWSMPSQQLVDQAPGPLPPSLFAPIAHSPFSEEPLPQPSDALPTLVQPVGDILVFTPTAEVPVPAKPASSISTPPEHATLNEVQAAGVSPSFSWDLADYPTETRVQVPGTPSAQLDFPAQPSGVQAPPFAQPLPSNDRETPGSNLFPGMLSADPGNQAGAWPGNVFQQAGVEQENFAAFFQPPPTSQPLGNVYPGPFEAPPISQPLGNVYPGLPKNAGSALLTGQHASGSLAAAEVSPLVRPLPRWASLSGIAAGALLLLALVFLNPDWVTGAMVAGMVAVIFALLLLIAAGVRVALGLLAQTNPHRRAQVISTALLVVLLFLCAGLGLSRPTGLHALQARFLEGQHSWQTAVLEYQAAGETPPASENLARTYIEWGESLSHQQQYGDAVSKFAIVLRQYPRATGQLGRARSDLVAAYLAWADYASHHQDYAGATAHYDALLASGYCDSACQSLTQSRDATAYDQLAEQQLAARQYAPAVAAFKTLTTRFASSPEAGRVHADYAQALWGLGQQQLGTACTDAIATYQQLAKQFADTSQGKQAATALQQPVQAKGRFTQSVPGAPNHPTAFLVQGLFVGIQQYQFPPLLRTAPTTQINADGTFAFPSVPPGTYELVWSSDGTLHFYYAFSGNQVLYTAHIGPLCAYDFGNIDQAIPTSTNG